MAKKRKTISKKIRFEVFKRDKFTCQYCGKQAPDVVLNVDHIHPVAKGGEDVMLKHVAKTARNWTDWHDWMTDAIDQGGQRAGA